MISPRALTLATRRSALALAQSRAFGAELAQKWPGLTFLELLVVTTGDKIQNISLASVGGKGLFIKEIEEALLAREADFAVHSYKDVPAEIPPGFVIAAVPPRADPRDAFVSREGSLLAELPRGAKVGTSSLRRTLELEQARPDLVIVAMRGNVDSRLRKLDEGQFDAIVLARAGLARLGLEPRITQTLDPEMFIPAAGQGALAIECRSDDDATREVLSAMHDEASGIAVACERAVMQKVGGGCSVPFGAHARRDGERLALAAVLGRDDGARLVRVRRDAPWPRTEAEAVSIGLDAGAELVAD